MCGIAGIISVDQNDISLQRLKKMTDIIAHRGPDGEGQWISANGYMGLGHRRLSIIDLSEEAGQPMHYLGRYTIIFNGEIYNYVELKEELLRQGYRFHTESDTEVLMALYHRDKENCLNALDGMFSFVIYDDEVKEIFAVRDRFGEKPFFYHYEPGKQFYFASEMKALWAIGVPRKINESMLFNYLAHGHLQNPSNAAETFYNNIVKLKAAHYLKIDVRQCRIIKEQQYWSLKSHISQPDSIESATKRFADLFSVSIKRRLRSDVPVGSSLSGGLDSSLVVMMIDEIKKGTKQVQKTFSARFPGYIKDEGKYMQMIIGRCHVEPHFTYPDDETILNDIEKVFYHQEEPFGSASICAQYEVMKLARQNDVTVLLDGQGADEILAGYHSFFPVFFNEIKQRNPDQYKHEIASYRKLHQHNSINPVGKRDIKYFAQKYAAEPFRMAKKLRDQYRKYFNPEFNKEFYQNYNKHIFPGTPAFLTLNDSLLWSTSKVGLEQLLRYADRNSMAHSVEVRLPFLSHQLVEFLFSLPPDFKIRKGWTKWLMRIAFQQLLPSEITWRKDKIGYEPPQENWMNNKIVKDLIYEKRKKLVAAGILHKNVLRLEVSSEAAGERQTNSWAHWMAGNLLSSF